MEKIARSCGQSLPHYQHYYCCKANAWMNEVVMIAWVDSVLVPYVAMAPDHIIPLLILDSCRCHMMGFVVQWIQELGVEVQHPYASPSTLALTSHLKIASDGLGIVVG